MKKLLFIALSALLFVSCGDNNTPQLPSNSYFSVGEDKTIQFSPGLLEYNTVKQTYCFASSQVVIKASDDCINQFVWGHGEDPLFHSSDPEDYATFNDWGNYPIENYLPRTWRTLSDKEWWFLLLKRPHCDSLVAYAYVDKIGGFLLLPDNWEDVTDILIQKGLDFEYLEENHFTLQQWKKLESAGAVFLPYTEFFGTTLWTSSPVWDENGGLLMAFSPINYDLSFFVNEGPMVKHKDYVRLVKDYKPQK